MAYDFKNLNEIPTQDKPTENTTVMAFESGNPRQIPASEFGGKGLVVDLRSYNLQQEGQPTFINDIVYDPIYEAIMAGQNVVMRVSVPEFEGADMFAVPSIFGMMPGEVFMVSLSIYGVNFLLGFTNGSYHTTE